MSSRVTKSFPTPQTESKSPMRKNLSVAIALVLAVLLVTPAYAHAVGYT